jgi:hypothetical protein
MNTVPVFDDLCRKTAEKLLAKLAQVVDRSDAIEDALVQNGLSAHHFTRDYYWSYCTPENIDDEKLLFNEGTKEGFATVFYARDVPPIVGYRSRFFEARLKAAGVDRYDPLIGQKISQRVMAEREHIKRDQPGALARRQASIPLRIARKREEAVAYAARLSHDFLHSCGTPQDLALLYFKEFGFKPQRGRRPDLPFALRKLSANLEVGLVYQNIARGDLSTSSGSHGLDIHFQVTGKNGAPLVFRKDLLNFLMGIRVYHECESLEDVHLAYFVQRTVYSVIADLIEL